MPDTVVVYTKSPDTVLLSSKPADAVIVEEPEGPPGPPGSSQIVLVALAAVDLSGHRLVRADSSGHLVYADPSAALVEPIMLTLGAASAGSVAQALVEGLVTEPSWTWTVDQPVWAAPGGFLTQVLPVSGVLVQVALPVTPTQLMMRPMTPLVLA